MKRFAAFSLLLLFAACDSPPIHEEEIESLTDQVIDLADLDEETQPETTLCISGTACGFDCGELPSERCACQVGAQACSPSGEFAGCLDESNSPVTRPGDLDEECGNGVDDDCDGLVDEADCQGGCEGPGAPDFVTSQAAQTTLVLPEGMSLDDHPLAASASLTAGALQVYGFVVLTLDQGLSPEEMVDTYLQQLAAGADGQAATMDDNRAAVGFRQGFEVPGESWQLKNPLDIERAGVRVDASFSYGATGTNPLREGIDPARLRDAIIATLSGVPITTEDSAPLCAQVESTWVAQTRPDGGFTTIGLVVCGDRADDEEVRALFSSLGSGTLSAPAGGTMVGTPDGSQCEYLDPVVANHPVDFLWVIDNSGSMADEQQNLAAAAHHFATRLNDSGCDWRLAVTTTEAYGVNENPWGELDLEHDELLDGATGLRGAGFVGRDELDAIDLFIEYLTYDAGCEKDFAGTPLGDPGSNICGSGFEDGLLTGAVVLDRIALEERSEYALRDQATTVVIWVSDEEAQAYKPDDMTTIISEEDPRWQDFTQDYIERYQAHDALAFGIVGDPGLEAGGICEPLGDSPASVDGAQFGSAYATVAATLGGGVASICNPDLSASVRGIVDGALSQSLSLPLSAYPIVSTIQVVINDEQLAQSERHGWSYDPLSNALVLFGVNTEDQDQIMVSYASWSF